MAGERKKRSKSGFKMAAEAALEDIFSDMSVPAEETLDILRDLRANLDCKIGSIEADLKRKGGA